MRVMVLRRGGLSVYGGSYDAKQGAAVCPDDQQRPIDLVFPEEITALDITENGMTASTPVIATTKATFTISGAGYLECVATMGDERPKVIIRAESVSNPDYGC